MAKAKSWHAVDFLKQPANFPAKLVCVLFGDDAFLKFRACQALRKQLLAEGDAEFSLSRYEGNQTVFSAVQKELAMMTMFGGGQRVVVIDNADPFVTKYRAELESYADAPSKNSNLILLLNTFPSNTRLYKIVDSSGFLMDCSSLSEREIPKWLTDWASHEHQVSCDVAAAELLVDFVGTELGLLDQELAKLSLSVAPGAKLTAKIVQQQVGSWRSRTTWEMLDLALDGNVPEAIRQLDLLLQAGETPVGLLAQVAYTLRRFAAATQLILDAEKQGKRIALQTALEQAGIKRFVLQKAESQLKKLGRYRGEKLSGWLLHTDLALKGDSRVAPRIILEKLLLQIAAPQLRLSKP
ncbi:MAG: DNA polymerase III subunit delta [Planctomycetaceae bacterium]|jgi:DNA polymerase-3 subunit delta|nr:DNA polymerase III subunit delta [Planctomycetaceae bacterium]